MVLTYKNKFNNKYGYPKDTSHSLKEIADLTGYDIRGLNIILSKGQGAFYSNPSSVRPSVNSSTQWAYARVYSAIMGGKASVVDAKHLSK